MGRGEITLVCESAVQIQLSQTNFSDEVRLITYSHLSFDLVQNKPKNMNVLTKARGVKVFCVKEVLRCGLTPIYVPSISTASEHGFKFQDH